MNDPIGHAFVPVPLPEPGADFDREVIRRLAPLHSARVRQARRVMIVYWAAACLVSLAGIVEMKTSPGQLVIGGVALTIVWGCSLLAAGGARNLARALRTTWRET